ncbi:putative bifunctional diguanylate cyclase/phosphodiesterase [Piscinibacter koreensis]|uniref:EAL domain-containing protein n=1 Tax=Piscinibacter koreensis TaxID=2742824 RepID=A0A7Y6NL89_9BURK|nr:EAL domain-containing protein [Schlegelella koreensis]NUZ05266.1 EAL domain-containing protein [Schlegelella koreensis]
MTLRVPFWERSIGVRIIVLFLGMLLAVQLASFTALQASLSQHAHRVLPNQLREGERLLQSLLERKAGALVDGARLLAADYGFREAVSSNDADTIVSVLANHGARIGATEAALLGTDFALRASTAAHPNELVAVAHQLRDSAIAGQPSTIALVAGTPHQAVLVPVRAPLVVGWVLMAFPVDPHLGDDMRDLSGLGLTLVSRRSPDGPWRLSLTSLDAGRSAGLVGEKWPASAIDQPMTSVMAAGEELGVRVMPLGRPPAHGAAPDILALVSLSVDDAVRLPRDLQLALIGITLLAIGVFAVGSVFTARRVTTPLRALAAAAERLGAGDFETPMRGQRRHDEVGELSQAFERMRTRVAENQAQILRLAYWDSLTGLPNRARFREAVNDAIAERSTIAVVMLDLNRFKHVNDVLGYRIGDLLLIQVGQRLASHLVREGELVARLSGDEFGILLRVPHAALALSIAERIERAFDEPLALEEHRVDMRAAIGVACWPQHADDGDALLNRAELAMYAAKRRSSGPVLYAPSIDVASAQTLTLLTELREAVERGELRLYLQPKLALDDGRVIGAEALVRWQHRERGLVPPGEFIPFAEQTGFIRVLTLWVFEEAARHHRRLGAGAAELVLSVNLSTRDLLDPELPLKFAAVLARHRVPAEAFCFEITESAIMDDPARALAILDRLSEMGFQLSIDDFGTGYSSLAYLKRLPVDEIKIDQSFVRSMQSERDDATIVRSTIDLAHNLGLQVVAEGVESAEVWNMLRELGCDQAQGYHMGRPMPVDEFARFVERKPASLPAGARAVALTLH